MTDRSARTRQGFPVIRCRRRMDGEAIDMDQDDLQDTIARLIAGESVIPKRRSTLPAMIVELKWNKETQGAIALIKDRNYPKILTNYGGKIVLVGVNYDEDTKKHACEIEEYKKE